MEGSSRSEVELSTDWSGVVASAESTIETFDSSDAAGEDALVETRWAYEDVGSVLLNDDDDDDDQVERADSAARTEVVNDGRSVRVYDATTNGTCPYDIGDTCVDTIDTASQQVTMVTRCKS